MSTTERRRFNAPAYVQASNVDRRENASVLTPVPVKVSQALYTPELEIDLALVKRDTARTYRRKKLLLRAMVNAGLLTPEDARLHRYAVDELRVKWRAARAMLRNGCAILKEG